MWQELYIMFPFRRGTLHPHPVYNRAPPSPPAAGCPYQTERPLWKKKRPQPSTAHAKNRSLTSAQPKIIAAKEKRKKKQTDFNLPAARGEIIRRLTRAAPVPCPLKVMRFESPPKPPMLSFSHTRAATFEFTKKQLDVMELNWIELKCIIITNVE